MPTGNSSPPQTPSRCGGMWTRTKRLSTPAWAPRMERAAVADALQVLRSRAPGIARAFAYLILRERDLRAVRAVLRGRHLGLPGDDIRLALRRGSAGMH